MNPIIIKPREQPQESTFPPQSSRKRKNDDVNNGANNSVPSSTTAPSTKMLKSFDKMNVEKKRQESSMLKPLTAGVTPSAANKKARETRLEQNRKAARESRRRKKVMIEDLQRSVIFFSRANGALKHQNDELTRLLMQAQAQVSVIESTNAMNNTQASATTTTAASTTGSDSQLQQDNENKSHAEAKLASNDAKSPVPAVTSTQVSPQATTAQTYPPVPVMQPGATMQAMANFQQAAAAAMQVAVQGMQGISPGTTLTSLTQASATTGSASAQQAYNDTMTALAMQQAAIAAAAVPSQLMAQIVGNNPWSPAQAPTAGTPVAPATILPVVSTQASSTTPSSNPVASAGSVGSTTSEAAPLAVAPMPLLNAMTTKGVGES